MIHRRKFLKTIGLSGIGLAAGTALYIPGTGRNEDNISEFCKRLVPVGRILEDEKWSVWGPSPIRDESGKIHVFFSRWPAEPPTGWKTHSEIAHAIADDPAGPYEILGTILKGRGGDYWDAVTIHNPNIHKVGNKYALFYCANSDGTLKTMRVGLAMADSLYGPWDRIGDKPIINVSSDLSDWDSYMTDNPSFLQHPNGEYWLYYRAWDPNKDDLRKIGLAIADDIHGPYRKHPDNPIIDFTSMTAKAPKELEGGRIFPGNQVEDPYVWYENDNFHVLLRDFGMHDYLSGIYMSSKDGIHWDHDNFQVGYRRNSFYFNEPADDFERPQLLFKDNKPEYLFLGLEYGKRPRTGAVLKIQYDQDI